MAHSPKRHDLPARWVSKKGLQLCGTHKPGNCVGGVDRIKPYLPPLQLYTHREGVDAINAAEMRALDGEPVKYYARDTGSSPDALKAGCPVRTAQGGFRKHCD